MAKSPFNIQDQYLNQARKERVLVDIAMMSGDKLQGYIKSFDSFCVLVDATSQKRLIDALKILQTSEGE